MTRSAASPDLSGTRVLLIGAGNIAAEYVKALQAMGCGQIGVLSRDAGRAQKLSAMAYGGGEDALPGLVPQYDAFIVATPVSALKQYAEFFAQKGVKNVLIEKPAFLFSGELEAFLKRYRWNSAVALNRLYYPSVEQVRRAIREEGVTSVEFSFTEWVHRIPLEKFSSLELERWGVANCIHVISTVFDLIGLPKEWQVAQHGKGGIPWHPHGSIFMGHGMSERGVPFSYNSDWTSAGRWSITVRNTRGAYRLRPMEGVEFTPKGSIEKQVALPPWNGPTKCGFVPMLEAWFGGTAFGLSELLPHIRAIEHMFGYAPAAE